jgi:hypothetical protein
MVVLLVALSVALLVDWKVAWLASVKAVQLAAAWVELKVELWVPY